MRYLVIALMFTSLPAFAQTSGNYLKAYFNSHHQNESADRLVVDKVKQIDTDTLCKLISPYLNDSLSITRLNAYRLLHQRGIQSIIQQDRQKIVSHLLSGWFDADTGINGFVASALSMYAKNDFTASTKDDLTLLVNQQPGYYDKLLRIAGFLQIEALIPVLQQKLTTKIITNERQRWAAYLALSRMGDNNAAQFVLNKVKSLGVNDDVVYTLFPDLSYTRQRAAIDYLLEQLYNNEKNCSSPNAEHSKSMPCAYRVMEYLAVAIRDYPIKTDANGELMIDNYEEALQNVRQRMKTRAGLYIIDDEHL